MSEKGGSDLDVFDNVSKGSPPARKKTLLGLNMPGPPPASAASNSRASLPPPPPPSLRASAPPPAPYGLAAPGSAPHHDFPADESGEVTAELLEGDEDEAEEIDEVDEASSPLAAPGGDIYDDDDATRVFSGLGSSADASVEPPTPIMNASYASPFAPAPPVPSAPMPSAPLPSRPLPPPPAPLKSSRPPPPPPSPIAAAAAEEWEEEDDKTAIFSRESGFDAAHMLMGASSAVGSLPDLPPPPMSRPSAPLPSAPGVLMPSPTLPRIEAARDSVPPAPASKMPLVLAVLAAVALGVALLFVLRPTTGGLVITVAGPGNEPVKSVQVLVDGKVVCGASPCSLEDLEAGPHMVQARAPGYQQNAETAVLVTGGQDAVHNIRLSRGGGTGIRVSGQGTGLRLFVDGKDVGPLPQELDTLSPGSHTLKVTSDQYESFERKVTVTENEMLAVEVPALKVLKGLAVIKAGSNADDARVVLESDGDRRVLPSLPINLHIDTSKPHRLSASRRGYETFRQDLVFEDGQAEKTFEISLQPSGEEEASSAATRGPRRGGTPRSSAPAEESAAPATGQATLNLNSIPAANVILDGRPMGRTPKLGVKVSPGAHTVMFVHEGQRISKSVTVGAGKSATVVHRF